MGFMQKKASNIYNNKKERQYIIDLKNNRSFVALIVSFVSLVIVIFTVTSELIIYAKKNVPTIDLFQFFTVDANIFMAFGSAMIIPYAIDGFRKKRFYCPKWVVFLYYSGTICTTLIMFFSVCVISFIDFEMAFFGSNTYLHIVCPIMILISFLLIESYYSISIKDAIKCCIPMYIYTLVYIYKVIIVGKENGGWDDIYYFTINAPAFVSLTMMLIVTFLIAMGLRFAYNKLSKYRIKKLSDNLWKEDVSDVEIKIELFGLGRYMGKKDNKAYAIIPLDVVLLISNKYHIKKEELIAAYMKGVIDSITE